MNQTGNFFRWLKLTPSHWHLIYLGTLIYFCLLVPINVLGAKDINMLAVFMIDEIVVYDTVRSMINSGVVEFLNPKMYVYGYLYHFLNAIVLLLLRPVNYFIGLSQTNFDVLVLRQLSALYYLIAIILVLRTFFKKANAISIFLAWLALISLPAAFQNNTWLHPDNLAFLLIILTSIALVTDRGSFGKWFWFAAICWGLATNTKMLGVFLIPLFFYYCWRSSCDTGESRRNAIHRLIQSASLATAVFLISMPFLFFPGNLHTFLGALFTYSATYVTGTNSFSEVFKPILWYRNVIGDLYFHWIFLLCILSGTFLAIRTARRETVILLLATTPMLLHFLINVSWTGFWYLIPPLVPIFSLAFFATSTDRLSALQRTVCISALLIAGFQVIKNGSATIGYATTTLNKERASLSLELYKEIETTLGDKIKRVRSVFRDPYVYIPASEDVHVINKWGLASYSDIEDQKSNGRVDLIVLQKDYIGYCSSEAELRRYSDSMAQDYNSNSACIRFYSDASNRKLDGYAYLTENNFGVAFIKDDL
jgi:hypothetical protein